MLQVDQNDKNTEIPFRIISGLTDLATNPNLKKKNSPERFRSNEDVIAEGEHYYADKQRSLKGNYVENKAKFCSKVVVSLVIQ